VLLLDSLGELLDFYAAADVAFVGGSLVPIGGHNLLEPAALGVPILTGPYNSNSEEIARLLIAGGAAEIVRDAATLGARVSALLQHAHDVIVAAAGVVGLRLHQGLARVEDVDRRAGADLVARLGGFERRLTRLERLAQRLHACDAADHAEVGVARLTLGGA